MSNCGDREPKREKARSAFSFPRLGGSEELCQLVTDYGGISEVSKDFKIGADLLNRYMVGQLEPPYSLLLAIYWQSSYGFRQGFAESHWTHQYNSFTRKQAEAKVRYLETVVQHAIQLLEHRPEAADLARQMLSQVAAERSSGDPLAGSKPLIRDGARPIEHVL